jgi:PAS domain S-box-containing protein
MSQDQRQEHELLLKIFETSPIAIVVANREGVIFLANSRAEKTLGLTRKDIAKRVYDDPTWTITDFDGNEFPAENLPFNRVKACGKPVFNIQHAIVNVNGSRILLNINAAPLFGDQGEFDGMVASLEDITKKVEADRAYAESEAMLKSIFRAAPIGIGVVKSRVLTWTNYKIQQMTGYTEAQLEGRSARMLYPTQEDFEFVGREKYRQIEKFGTGTVETRWVTRDGRLIDVLLSSTPIDPNNRDRGVTFSALDITGRKQMEERIRHSEKMEAVGQLAGGIAHDFNNQLTGIMGFADLLREEAKNNATMSRYISNVLVCSRRAADLTNKLLAFARKGKYLSVPVDLHRLVAEVVSLLERSINKNITIEQDLKADPPTTRGDPSQLQNALLNLALNARDAMPDGGKLVLATEVVDVDVMDAKHMMFDIAPGAYVKLSVRDAGVGIAPCIMTKIFDPFFTTKEEGKGTGLGLPAVYGTVKIHRGGISIQSEQGVGSTFSLFLPSIKEDSAAVKEAEAAASDAVFAGKHILIVDDEEPIRQLSAVMLESVGCRVSSAGDGREAVDLYRRMGKEIDAVILDIVMPNMDGIAAFRALKEINPNIRVLLSSGYSIQGDAQKLLKEGAADFLQKPFLKPDLIAKLSMVFRV